jgi:carboxyl-terminal processing protease
VEIQLIEKSRAPVRYFAVAIICVFFGVAAIFASAKLSFRTPLAVPGLTIIDSPVLTESREGRLAVFDDVWQTVFDRYYDSSFGGVDWKQQREHFRPLAGNAAGTAELYSILREMVASLRDAHTRVIPPNENSDWRIPRYIGVGISTREIDGSDVVVSVEPESDALRAGISPGDLVLSVDGNATPLNGGVWTPRSTTATGIQNIFDGEPESQVRIILQNRFGVKSEVMLKREIRSRSASLIVRSSRHGIAVMTFDSFTEHVLKQLQDALAVKRRHKRALILDLRNNGGGDTEVMAAIASIFLPAGTSLGSFFDREGRISLEPRTAGETALNAHYIQPFEGSLVLLTSRRTASAAEIFVSALRQAGRAKQVGEKTCGCVLAIRSTHSLPDGGALDVSELDYRTPQGLRLEGQGILPEIDVPLSIGDVRAGRDRALEMALENLRNSRRK